MNPLKRNPTIGWIGTGVMGRSMFGHILTKGYQGVVLTVQKKRPGNLSKKGQKWCNSPYEIARQSDVIFTMVGFPDDVREVYLSDEALIDASGAGTILVDMTTTSPSLACEIHNKALEKGIYAIDAPVSGGDIGARNATLSIMAGGDKEVFDAVLPLFEILGKKIILPGKAGSGQHTKMLQPDTDSRYHDWNVRKPDYGNKAGLDLATMLSSIFRRRSRLLVAR